MSFSQDLKVTGAIDNIVGGGIASYFDNATDPDNIYVLSSGIVVKNDNAIQPVGATTKILKYNTTTKVTTELSSQSAIGAANMSAVDTSGKSFIVSGRFDLQGGVNSAVVYDISAGVIQAINFIPRMYPTFSRLQEGAACAIATITGVVNEEYCAIGVPRFGATDTEFLGNVLMYKRTQPNEAMVFYKSLTTALSTDNDRYTTQAFFGYALEYVYLNNILHIAVGVPQFYSEGNHFRGYVELFAAETGKLKTRFFGLHTNRNFGWGIASNKDFGANNILAMSGLNVKNSGTVKHIQIFADMTGNLPTDLQIIEEEFSTSPAINFSNDGTTLVSGITNFSNGPSGRINVYKRDLAPLTEFVKTSVITQPGGTPFGYSVNIISPNDITTEQYTVIAGANPVTVSTNGEPTYFGDQTYYSALLKDGGNCFTEVSGGVTWPTTTAGASATVASCGIEGYIPDPNGSVPPFSRDCDVEAFWDPVPTNGGCVLPANSCDIEIENNIQWPVTTYGASSAGTCLTGTVNPLGIPLVRNCQAGGTWAPTLFSCLPMEPVCSAQSSNNIQWSATNAGEIANGTCDISFVKTSEEPLERECNLLGVWEPSSDFCVSAENVLNDGQYYGVVFGVVLGVAIMIMLLGMYVIHGA